MRTLLFVILTGFFLVPDGFAAEFLTDLTLNGSLKSLNLYAEQFTTDGKNGAFSSDSLRVDLGGRVFGDYRLDLALEQQLLRRSRSTAATGLTEGQVNRYFDLETVHGENERLSSKLQVDRLNLHGEAGSVQWSLGRQPIGFGRISLFSPLDVIAPFPPDVLDSDVRPGVDAVRLNRYFGLAGQLGGVFVLGDEGRHNSALLTFGENYREVDAVGLAGRLRGRTMAGLGLGGELGDLGLKAEASWYRGRDVGEVGGDLRESFVVAAFEGWYRFDSGLVLIGQYLYNGIGSDDPGDYPLVAVSAPVVEGLGYLLGRHYLLLGPSYQLHPLIQLEGLVIYNADDGSSLLRPLLSVSLADNLQLDLFWALSRGKKERLDPLTGLPEVRSEFGSAGDSGGLLLRWYF